MSAILRLRTRLLAAAERLGWLPPLLARVAVGWVFLESGWGKLHNLPRVIDYFASLGIPAPELQAPLAAGTELVCGALLLAGLFTRLAALPLIVVMAVAIKTARVEDLGGASDLFGFVEYLYILLCAYLAVSGPGALALDRLLVRALERPRPEPLPGAMAPSRA